MKTISSELQRIAEERHNNVLRHVAWLKKSAELRYHQKIADYKDKRLGAEYENWLDKIGHP